MSSIANPGSAAFEAFEADGWEQQAAGYDAFFRTITTSTAEAVLDAAASAPARGSSTSARGRATSPDERPDAAPTQRVSTSRRG